MSLRELMWKIFQSTGNIDAYLIYRECAQEPRVPVTEPKAGVI